MLPHARAYNQRSWHIFPLHSPGRTTYCDCGDDACPSPAKHPWTRNGLKDATLDLAQVERWWSKSWTRANIGVACGPSGLTVLDVDPRHGGDLALIELVKRHSGAKPGRLSPVMEALYATLVSETGGGGEHLVYRTPDPTVGSGAIIHNTTNLDGLRGLDVRASGGYFVAPPSMHVSGARYLWRDGVMEPQPLPDWLLPVLTRRNSRPVGEAVRMFTPPRDVAETGAYWLDRALRLAMEGTRNDRGFWLACQLRDSGLPQDAAEQVLESYAARVPGVGYSTREALNSVRSAYKTTPREVARSATSASSAFNPADLGRSPVTPATPAAPDVTGMTGEGAYRPDVADGPGPHASSDQQQRQGQHQGQSSEARPRFTFLSDEEVEHLPAPEWLVEGLLVQGQRSMVFGEPGSYKSFLALDLALCIATGTPWHGHETLPGRVVYIAGEGKAGIGKRITAWKLYHEYQGSAPISILGEAAQLLRGGDIEALIEAIQTLPELPVAIFIDTLARSIVGGDENSAQDMGKVIAAIDYLHEQTGAHIVLIHHKARAGKNARGSTAVPGGMDTTIDLTRDGSVVTMRCDKQKDAAEFAEIPLRFEVTLHADNLLESSGVLVPADATSRKAARGLPRSAQQALSILCDAGTIDWKTWKDRYNDVTGQSDSAFANAYRALTDEGYVAKDNGRWFPTAKGKMWMSDHHADGQTEGTPWNQ